MKFTNVLHVSGFGANLLSVKHVTSSEHGCEVSFKSGARLYDSQGEFKNSSPEPVEYTDIYPLIYDVLRGNRRSYDRAALTASLHRLVLNNKALVTRAATLQLHEQMAHVGAYHMKKMFPELTSTDLANVSACTACLTAKMARRPYRSVPAVWKATRPGKIALVDFLNPSAESVGGGEYLFVVIDQFTSFLQAIVQKILQPTT